MYKVVLVEDEALLRQGLLLTTPWAAHGYTVVGQAGDACEGERVILETQPDLVITDIRLPKVVGHDVVSGLDMLESLTDKTLCDSIIISGHDEFDYAQRAISLGVKAYLLKPIDDLELLAALDKVAGDISRRKAFEATVVGATHAALQTPPHRTEKTIGDRYLEAALAHIRAHFAQNITVKSVADALCISESYLTKLFRRKTGRSFLDTLTLYRMEEAVRLLEESHLKVYEIANRLGYQDTQYFSNLFRKVTGVNPSEYKHG